MKVAQKLDIHGVVVVFLAYLTAPSQPKEIDSYEDDYITNDAENYGSYEKIHVTNVALDDIYEEDYLTNDAFIEIEDEEESALEFDTRKGEKESILDSEELVEMQAPLQKIKAANKPFANYVEKIKGQCANYV